MDDQLARKMRSEVILDNENVPINRGLPIIESEEETELREPLAVARRALVVTVLAGTGFRHGLSTKEASELIESWGLSDALTPEEDAHLSLEEPAELDRNKFAWRVEGALVLFWALNRISQLGRPDRQCDPSEVFGLAKKAGPSGLLLRPHLRAKAEILDASDVTYRYHWACVEARIHDHPAPSGLDQGVVFERHYAMNWLTNYMDQDWDHVSTDT